MHLGAPRMVVAFARVGRWLGGRGLLGLVPSALGGVIIVTRVTETVAAWRDYWTRIVPLPHPSPRNNRWLVRNPGSPLNCCQHCKKLAAAHPPTAFLTSVL